VGKGSKLFCSVNGKKVNGETASVKKSNTSIGNIKVPLDNRVKDLIRKMSLDLIELVQFLVSSKD